MVVNKGLLCVLQGPLNSHLDLTTQTLRCLPGYNEEKGTACGVRRPGSKSDL